MRPLLLAACALCTGIALAYGLYGAPAWWPLILVAFLLIAGRLFMLVGKRKWAAGSGIVMLFFSGGVWLCGHAAPTYPAPPEQAERLVGRVERLERTRAGTADYVLSDVRIDWQGRSMELEGDILLYGVVYPRPIEPGETLTASSVRLYLPQGQRNPGGFNARLYYYIRGVAYTASHKGNLLVEGEAQRLPAAMQKTRLAALAGIDALWPQAHDNALLRALLIGDTGQIEDDTREAFSKLGTAHVLAVSGLHVGFVLLLLSLCTKLLFLPVRPRQVWLWPRLRRIEFVLLGIGLLGYCVLTGFSAPVMRAVLMALVLRLAGLFGVRRDDASSLAFSLLCVLLVRPMDIFSVSMQLSYGAVAGMLLLGKPVERLMAKLTCPAWLRSGLCATISAQLGLMPLLALYFGQIPLLGLLANLFAVPLSGAAAMLGLPALGLHFVWPEAAAVLSYPALWCTRLLEELTMLCARLPGVSAQVAAPSPWMTAIYYAALLALPALKGRVRVRSGLALATAGAVAVCAWLGGLYPSTAQVTVLDVGQGLGALVRQGNTTLMIDAGPASNSAVLDSLQYEGKRIDAAFLTHGHEDHIGAVSELLARGKIRSLYVPPGFVGKDTAAQAVLDAAREQGVPVREIAQGDVIVAGKLSVRVLSPRRGQSIANENDRSLLLAVGADGQEDVLFTGDLTRRGEQGLIIPVVRVLQVAHHGSQDASGDALLSQARPQLAIIPVGRNSYGHPAQGAMERIRHHGAQIERTDVSGAIRVKLGYPLRIRRWDRER